MRPERLLPESDEEALGRARRGGGSWEVRAARGGAARREAGTALPEAPRPGEHSWAGSVGARSGLPGAQRSGAEPEPGAR